MTFSRGRAFGRGMRAAAAEPPVAATVCASDPGAGPGRLRQRGRSSVVVSVDTQTRVNLDLEVDEISEQLVVEASEGQLLKTDRADVSTTFERKQVTELPGAQVARGSAPAAAGVQRLPSPGLHAARPSRVLRSVSR